MSLEAVLREHGERQRRRAGTRRRTTSRSSASRRTGASWGWRVEGHHLSLNFTLEDGAIVSATPAFFGANPAEVRQGPREGLRTLADLEDRALRLVQALDDDQQGQAVVAEEAPRDIESNTGAGQGPGGGLAIAAARRPSRRASRTPN